MGREVNRVPMGFDWPMKEIWFGFILDPIPCELCGGTGKPKHGGTVTVTLSDKPWTSEYCPVCEGEGDVRPKIELPEGPSWQMWENTSEGSPISPVFDTPEELARWLADNKASAFGDMTATYEQWLRTIESGGAIGAAITEKGLIPGVALE